MCLRKIHFNTIMVKGFLSVECDFSSAKPATLVYRCYLGYRYLLFEINSIVFVAFHECTFKR